jgi:RNA polymerase sigma-70 factor (ECF subfamily)
MLGIAVAMSLRPAGLERAEAGRFSMDEEAFRAFYAATARPLWAYLFRAGGDHALADDLVQEAYLRLLGADFRPENEDHRRAYLYRIATNLLHDHYRAARPSASLDERTAVAEERTDGLALEGDLDRVLQELKPRERQLLWLAHVEGWSHKEIAATLGLKAESIRLLLFRARQRLAERLRRRGLAPKETS